MTLLCCPFLPLITGAKIKNNNDMIFAANKLIEFGVSNVLIKGGHLKSNKLYDIFVNKKEIKIFKKRCNGFYFNR